MYICMCMCARACVRAFVLTVKWNGTPKATIRLYDFLLQQTEILTVWVCSDINYNRNCLLILKRHTHTHIGFFLSLNNKSTKYIVYVINQLRSKYRISESLCFDFLNVSCIVHAPYRIRL